MASGRRRGGAVWLWVLVSIAAVVGIVALDVVAIISTSALLGTQGYPGTFPSSPLGVRTITIMALAIAGLVMCAVMAGTGLLAFFGVCWATLLFGLATFVAFVTVAIEVLLGNPVGYTDPVSRFGVDHNGHPLEGTPMWGGVLLMFLLLASLTLTRSVYRYGVRRATS